MIDFEFKRPTRRCSKTDREIMPGESFYTALVEQADSQFDRIDFSCDAWEGPPPDCIGWWKSKIPDLNKGRVYWAPNSVLLSVFEHALNQPDQADLAYVMALVLIRKKAVQWKETLNRGGKKYLLIYDAKSKKEFEVEERALSLDQSMILQKELAEKLFSDHMDVDEGTGNETAAE